MTWDITIANFCFKPIFSNVCQYFVAIFCYKTHKKTVYLYLTQLIWNAIVITVQFYTCTSIGGCQCNKCCTHANVKARRIIFAKLWKQLILRNFSTLTLVNKCTVAFNKNSSGCKKCTGITLHLIKAPWFFSEGSSAFLSALRRSGGATPTPQGCRYRDQIVLRLLNSFLLLPFFNLKTLDKRGSARRVKTKLTV